MTKRVSLKQMRQALSELRQIAASYKCRVRIYRRPVIWNRYGMGQPNFGEVRGHYAHNEAVVVVYGRASRRRIIATVAHEIRHAIHEKSGMYPDYYKPRLASVIAFLEGRSNRLPKSWIAPDEQVAYAAENDCNAWADLFLEAKGIAPLNEEYCHSSTLSAQINHRIAMRLNELGQKS